MILKILSKNETLVENLMKIIVIQVHSCPVKCLEWCGLDSLISAAYLASLSASSSLVRNDIFAVDIHTGVKRRIRPEQEESPVEMIRVSHYRSVEGKQKFKKKWKKIKIIKSLPRLYDILT